MNKAIQQNRIETIDILRGFSILGIFLVNMPSFHSPFMDIDPLTWWNQNPDHLLYILVDVMAQASFYPLFAFLFGFGAILLAERSAAHGQSFPTLFVRRMTTLLVIGILHAFLVWHGDILITYALFGFVFLLFYKWRGKTLLIFGSLMYILPFAALSLMMLLMVATGNSSSMMETDFIQAEATMNTYQNGSFMEITEQRIADWYKVNNLGSVLILFFSIFPHFLMGAGIAKLKWLHNPKLHQKKVVWIAVFTFLAGFFLKTLPYTTAANMEANMIQDFLGGPIVSFAYIFLFTLVFQHRKLTKIFTPIAAVGRLSISNYLFQSIVATLIFYSYGLGIYGEISFTTGILFVFIIYIGQMALSLLWLRYFYIGPIEYIWRFFTYGKRPLFKK